MLEGSKKTHSPDFCSNTHPEMDATHPAEAASPTQLSPSWSTVKMTGNLTEIMRKAYTFQLSFIVCW